MGNTFVKKLFKNFNRLIEKFGKNHAVNSKILKEWNQTDKEYPAHKTIQQLFEEQVEKTPDNIAVVYEDTQLTYRELNQKANQLAHYLRQTYAIQGDDLIALCLDRSEQMLIAILAVLKSGAAYVPMDPSYPEERIIHILEDTQAKAVLANAAYGAKLEAITSANHLRTAIELIDHTDLQSQLITHPINNLTQKITSQNLAYVIYTSGTTGNPKGVMIEHHAIVNYLLSIQEKFSVNQTDVGVLVSDYIFDLGNTTIFSLLNNGATIHIVSKEQSVNHKFMVDYLAKNKIKWIKCTPIYFEFVILNSDYTMNFSLSKIILGGEICSGKLKEYFENKKNMKVYNHYGPTETTIGCICNTEFNKCRNNVIGFPINNISTFVLDNLLNPLPVGAIGELYIAGAGLARGYLNLPGLTAEKFIPNPFKPAAEKQTGKNARLYKTGDLVRYLPDGNIEYIGRNDFQVKIRGFRIELGEIEVKLAQYPEIKQTVVLAKEHFDHSGLPTGNKYLVGYYVANTPLDHNAILNYLSQHLPEYMVPAALVWLDKLPLTINGKLDRNALPDPTFTNASHYVAPRNELESQICALYADVLGLPAEQVGIHDDFFRLGGDSIHSILLVSRLRQNLALNVAVKDVLINKTVEKLYHKIVIEQLKPADTVLREEGILSGEAGLLPIESLFFSQVTSGLLKKPGHWNKSFLIKTSKLDRKILKQSLIKLIEYHDAFRLNFHLSENGDYRQSYCPAVEQFELLYLDIHRVTEDECQKILTDWQNDFELLGEKPLYRIAYLDGYADGSARIFFAVHHALMDTVSWRIVTNDLQTLYHKLLQAQENDQLQAILQQSSETLLGRKGTSYRQWVEQVKNYSTLYPDEQCYWQEVISGFDAAHSDLSAFADDPLTQNYAEFNLDRESTQLLLTECGHAYHTEINDLLLTGFGLALATLTHSSANCITLEGHGREEMTKETDITRTVGWFTILYPVTLVIDPEDITQSILMVKEALRKIPNKGIGYGAFRGYQITELPKICFNYLGQLDQVSDRNEAIEKHWRITDEVAGIQVATENQDVYLINTTGAVTEGELRFHVAAKLSQPHLEQLMAAFKQQLIAVIQETALLKRSYLTASDVDYIISQTYLDQLQAKQAISGVYLANSLQQGFIYHALNQGEEDTAYRVQLIFNYNNHLNPELLHMAWQGAIRRYPSLRLRFAWDEELVQIIDEHQDLAWQYSDISEQDAAQQQAWIDELIKADRKNPYHLDEGHLFRVFLIKCKENSYRFILSNHHAILDGWSNAFLLDFVHRLYLQLENSSHSERQQLIASIQEEEAYTHSQHYLQQKNLASEAYWREQLTRIDDYPDLSGLLNENQRQVHLSDYRLILDKAETSIEFQDGFYNRIKAYSSEHGVTVNVLLQYCWHKLLSVYGHSQTTIVGTTISGRNLPIDDIEHSVGLYINTLPLILRHDESKTISEELQLLQAAIHEMSSHSNVNLAQLQPSGRRLFDSLFVYENYPTPLAAKDSLMQFHTVNSIEELDYPLAILASDQNNQIQLTIKYAGELFNKKIIHQLLNGLQELLTQITTGVDQPNALSYLDASDYKKIIIEWNQTEKTYPAHKTIPQLFEEQVEKTPDNIAVVCGETQLTYHELNQKANKLAHYLRQTYVIQGDDLIALCLDRSEQALIAILGILKAGAAYVPMDPSYPEERITHILSDTKAKVILTSKKYDSKFGIIIRKNHLKTAIELIDRHKHKNNLKNYPKNNPINKITSQNLAYVIYTSGTTGKPKGVMIEHNGVVSFAMGNNFINYHKVNVVAGISSFAFDGSIFDIFFSFLNGKKLILLNETDVLNLDRFNQVIINRSVDTIFITTVFFNLLVTNKVPCLSKLSQILFGGESCQIDLVNQFKRHYNSPSLIHVYGPTETIVYATFFNFLYHNTIAPIGHKLIDKKLFVLDKNYSPLPIGAIGELCIGGAGLARGYLNLPELTAEHFIPNPFQSEEEKQAGENSRLYKTGDLVRYLPDGNVEHIGRNDFQVKIRGFRVELGEIETRLASYPEIKQTVVLAKEHLDQNSLPTGNKYLIGYYVANKQLSHDAILNYLSEHLPEYMVPAALVWLDKLPLTINGKLDRKALPDPEWINTSNYVAPRNDLESQVCRVYAEVLGLPIEHVGIRDDFFRLGGNSILAIKLISRLNAHVFNETELSSGFKINVARLFRHKTIANLLDSVLSEEEGERISIPRQGLDKTAPLSFAQERLWFIEKYTGGSNAYNIPLFQKLAMKVDGECLERSLRAVVARHEVLHSVIKTDEDGSGYQEVIDLNILPLMITHHPLQNHEEMMNLVNTEINCIFHLEREYPLRIHWFNIASSQEQYVLLVIHHIAFDGWSEDVFMHDLHVYYDYYRELSAEPPLPELPIQYKDFALWQKNHLSGDQLAHQLQYWKTKLSDYEALNVPTDKPRPPEITYEGETVSFNIGVTTSKKLRAVAKKHDVSLYSVLLAGFNLLLRSYSHQDDIVIGTPIANRHHEQLESLIGFFVNTLVLRSQINPEQALGNYIESVGQDIVEAQLNQDLPFEKLVDELAITKDPSRHPLFQIMFGVQNFGGNDGESSNALFVMNDFEINYAKAKFDLTLLVDDSREELHGTFNYAVSLFKKGTIDALIATYLQVLEQLPDESKKIKNLSYLNSADYKKIIIEWNQTEKAYPANKTIPQLFEEQVEKTPDNIAIVYKDRQLTYNELNQKSNQLANYLRQTYAIQPDDLIALCLDRSEQMLIAILAVLKSGAAYVPMDPNYPEERIIHILEDTGAKAVLANTVYGAKLENIVSANSFRTAIELIDNIDLQDKLVTNSISNFTQKINNQNLAYVLYTSGTTGKPKGVMIEHHGVVSLVKNTNYIKVDSDDVVLQLAHLGFDAATFEIYIALLHGLKLIILDNNLNLVADVNRLEKFLTAHKVSIVLLTTALFDQLYLLSETIFANIDYLLVGGEALDYRLIRKLSVSEYKPAHIINGYGPTENTTFSCTYKIINEEISGYKSIPIGRPLSNRTAYILDNNLNSVPSGAIGELHVGGAGLARGYLNQAELTAEKFIANPFQTEQEKQSGKNARLYKTGDLVRYLSDGDIEYIGRNDFQVKIRGFRVELGEIETKLASYPEIKQAVALAKEHLDQNGLPTGNKYLIGYYMANKQLNHDAILNYLSEHLPEYMVPAALVWLDKLPLTINGKLDRKALPDPEWTSSSNYVAPRNDLESRACVIYAEVLGLPVEKVSIHDDFFRLGGNSILAIKLISRLNSQVFSDSVLGSGLQINVAQLFRHKSIAALCESLLTNNIGYQAIHRYSHTSHDPLPKMIFVHPGRGGSEVYQNLAETLNKQYDCIGIDNYNLYHEKQINSLEEIATYYLSQLNNFYKLDEPIYLCGWSLGGQIALEIAYLLEKKGYHKICVICLDSLILDKNVKKYRTKLNSIETKDIIFKNLKQKYTTDYVTKIMHAYDAEHKILLSKNHPLEKTKVILYKAFHEDTELHSKTHEIKEFTQYVLALPNNNIDKICRNVSVINLPCHHGNMIEMIIQQCKLNPNFFLKNGI